jgi:GT2 family glycosyltransferase/membrane protein implicated in regulation of membrane protease activity
MYRANEDEPAHRVSASRAALELRPSVKGKFLALGGDKLWVRGVTYGTFRPAADGSTFPDRCRVDADLAQIAGNGFNAVRTYTTPPRWLLDLALDHGLRVMVGLPWEEHVAFLEERGRARAIERRLRADVRGSAGHPAVLAYAVGNEIPAPIVRWHGRRRVERFLDRLASVVRDGDPGALVTYVNFPTTEYLDLAFADFCCFNVYLESPDRLDAYLARLHTLAGDRPLVLAEVGLDSRRHGDLVQARALDAQVRTAFAAGCGGAFVFAWTDEWWRGGHAIQDWDFGLTDRTRRPKPALPAVRKAMAELPFPKDPRWPRVSVVVCSYNGSRTIRDCLDGLLQLEYPDFEVIVVDDGSTDATPAIARGYPVRLISTPNRGLSSARNTGLKAATGEIVAYIDDDASPDPHWLHYLVSTFLDTPHAGVGGPNIPPPGDGWIAECVAHSPGGPIHVLISDREAEHVPGCNMAFRRERLKAIGGFDPRFRTAGDDVDVCWRLQERGWTLGFSPAAMVWHRRRNSVRAYVRQQRGYGRAEALLEQKWPERYNGAGHTTWTGRLYGNGLVPLLARGRDRIYHGSWGAALFQSVYEPAAGTLAALPAMPEWWLLVLALAVLAVLTPLWAPLAWAVPLFVVALAAPVAQAAIAAARAGIGHGRPHGVRRRMRALIFVLHLVQPLARLLGRLQHDLTPWRWRGRRLLAAPLPVHARVWSEAWRAPQDRLRFVETATRASEFRVIRGGDFDRWDLEVRPGSLGSARLLAATEEHGAGRQLTRFRIRPRWSVAAALVVALPGMLALAALRDGARVAALVFALATVLILWRALREAAAGVAALRGGVAELARDEHDREERERLERAVASPAHGERRIGRPGRASPRRA